MRKKLSRKVILKIIAILLFAGVIYVIVSIFVSRYSLSMTTYKYDSEKINQPVYIIVLTDEHSNLFGKENKRLLSYVEKQNPDIIVIVGDVLNFYSDDNQFLYNLVLELEKISQVYFSPGNHETGYLALKKSEASELKLCVELAGGVYLDQDYIDIDVNNQSIRIGGINDYLFNNAKVSEEQYYQKDSYLFLKQFTNTNAFKLMLTHRPESYITNDEDAKWAIDLAVCGHEHGGQVRLPFIGGFYSTHLGLFSKYLDGYHMINGIPVVISRGLGTYYSKRTPPRFHNIPEIVKISLY